MLPLALVWPEAINNLRLRTAAEAVTGTQVSSQPGVLMLQRLPALNPPQPKIPIAGIARGRRKAAAFISPPPKFIHIHATLLLPTHFPS
jgi:hypothetical protein